MMMAKGAKDKKYYAAEIWKRIHPLDITVRTSSGARGEKWPRSETKALHGRDMRKYEQKET
jgi:hypothetical protein